MIAVALFDGIRTLIETTGELTHQTYPTGSEGTIVECLDKAYIVEFPVPCSDAAHGYYEEFDIITLTADQFQVVAPHLSKSPAKVTSERP